MESNNNQEYSCSSDENQKINSNEYSGFRFTLNITHNNFLRQSDSDNGINDT